jgi:micrococcal nuclease
MSDRRLVCKVMRDSMEVNFELVTAGMAWWYREYANEQTAEDRASYAAAEDDARATRDAKPVPPWEWRTKSLRGSK